ncbi:MAG: cation transporter [Chthonomonas sp.]|nr:cation transporter [Chthonomonas sp.]
MNPVQRAATISLIATTVVVCAKLAGGVVTGSISVLSEGLQSFVDVLIAFGVVQTIRLASLPPDDSHPYGHGKAEVLMSALQMVLITSTAGFIIAQAINRIRQPQEIHVDWGIAAMVFSAGVNLLVSSHLASVARKHPSPALQSEILHLRSDTVSAAGLIAGLVAVKLTGWSFLDPIMAILFTMVVVIAALRQLRSVIHLLMDGAAPIEDIRAVEHTLESHAHVRGFHNLRTRTVGTTHHVDIHVLLDDDLSFVQAHDLAEEVEKQISRQLGGARVNVHYEPYHAEMAHQRAEHQGQTELID